MKSSIASIPVELINAIIDELPMGSADLRNLRAVDRLFHHIATPNAFRRICIAHSLKSRDVNRTVYGYGRTPYSEYTAFSRTVPK
jgi:hypothetical protein